MATELNFSEMRRAYVSLGSDAFYMNHYELHTEIPAYSTEEWKKFITEPEINDWIRSELILIQQASLQKLLKDIENSNSTGKAQLIEKLQKLLNETQPRDNGPVFIYTFVPLSDQQEQAPNVEKLPEDIFMDTKILPTIFKGDNR